MYRQRQRQRHDKKNHQTTSTSTSSKCGERDKKVSARTGARLPAHFANAVFDEDTGQMLDYKKLTNHNKKKTREWWQQSFANEFGKLVKGAGRNTDGTQRVKGSDTLHFIHKKDITKGKKITYARFCCDI